MYKNGRADAMNHGHARPWDQGEFDTFKKRFNEGEESVITLNKNELSNRLEMMLQSKSLVWTHLDDMSKYDDNLPYKKFKKPSNLKQIINTKIIF